MSKSMEKTLVKSFEKQLVTYGDQWKGVSLDDGQTSLYSPEKAKASFAKAKAELQKQGVQFPIHLDYIVNESGQQHGPTS